MRLQHETLNHRRGHGEQPAVGSSRPASCTVIGSFAERPTTSLVEDHFEHLGRPAASVSPSGTTSPRLMLSAAAVRD